MSEINPVIITGSLDDSKLVESVDKLVAEIEEKLTGANGLASKFDKAINSITTSTNAFVQNQQSAATQIKQAWDGVGLTFDQMAKLQGKQTSGNGRRKSSGYSGGGYGVGEVSGESNEFMTVNQLEQLIKMHEKLRKQMVLESDELREQNKLIEQYKRKLKTEKRSDFSLADVMGMKEGTIDDITYKMRMLKSVQLDPSDKNAAKSIGQEYQRLNNKKKELLGTNLQLVKANKSLASAFNYLRNRIIFAFTIGSITHFVKDLIEVRAQYELLDRSIGILIGDFEKGTQIFNELSEMALKSPFTLIELGTAAKQLSAYNFAASEIVDTTKRLADISAALGVPMERLVYNLGQIKAQGVLNARDARDFANAGLAIVPMLAKMYTEQKRFGNEIVTTSKVYDMMKKKLVTYGDVLSVIEEVTNEGGKFFDYQAKQADTLKVQYANLSLAYNNMLNEIGTEYQDALSAPVKILKSVFANWKEIERVMKTVIVLIGTYKATMMLAGTMTYLKGILSTWKSIVLGIRSGKDAMIAFNTITKANPIGLVVAGLAALTSYLVIFKNKTKQASEEMNLFGESGSKLIGRLNVLQKTLKVSEKDSNLYKKSLSELSRITNEYGIELDEETAKRDEVNKKIAQTIELIKEESSVRNYANSMAKAQKTFEEGVDEARKKFEERLQGAMTGALWDGGFIVDNDELQENAQLIADTYANVIQQNLHLLVGKTGDEYDKAVEEIKKKFEDVGKELGLSEKTLSRTWLSDTLFWHTDILDEFIESIAKQGNVFNKVTAQISDYYEKAKKIEESTMSQKEKMVAYGKALKNLTYDAKLFYDKVYDIAEFAKTKYKIDIELNTYTKDIPKELLNKKPEELRNIAVQYASALQAGFKQKGGKPISEQLGYLVQVAAAYRRAMDDSERPPIKSTGSKKDVLGEAFQKEIQLINEMKKRYDEYRKMGVSSVEAQSKAEEEYGKSLQASNNVLAKHGVITKANNEIMVSDMRTLKDYYTYLLNAATRLGNTKGIEAAEKAIATLNVEIAKVDMKKITDGLNNDLSKIKDEYELAVELDATEGLGDALMDMLNIDSSDFPQTIQEYMDRVNKVFDEFRLKTNTWISPMDVFKMSEQDMRDWGTAMGLDEDYIKTLVAWLKNATTVVDKWVKDTVKANQTLEDELSTNADKIVKKEKEIADLRVKLSNSTNDIQRRNIELTIKKEQEALEKLRSEMLLSIPAYKALFGSIAEHSASMTRKLTDYLIAVFDTARLHQEQTGGAFVLDFGGGTTVTIDSMKQFQQEYQKITREAKKAQAPFDKLKEAFSPNEDGYVDTAKGLEYVSAELKKLSELVSTIGNVAEALGFSDETKEALDDIASSINGLSQVSDGIAAIKNKDYISGITSITSGLFTTISGWFDNSDKKIQRAIKESERNVKRLELAYKELQFQVEEAFGTAIVGAEKAALANKKLQLAEIQRQLQLEQSRSGKNRDEDRIISLKGEYEDLKHEIDEGYVSITNTLLGISSVGSAVENVVGQVISALRNGENAIDSWNSSIDDMITNLITKFVSTRMVAPLFEKVIDDMTDSVARRGSEANQEAQALQAERDRLIEERDEWYRKAEYYNHKGFKNRGQQLEPEIEKLNNKIAEVEALATQQSEFTVQDLDYMISELMALKGKGADIVNALPSLLEKYGLSNASSQTQLSNLQQGIQGVTETTAGAVEAYLNDVLQQMYVNIGLQTQILAQMQASVATQMAIKQMINDMQSADGYALRVQMI